MPSLVGSEMCIRDRILFTPGLQQRQGFAGKPAGHIAGKLSGIIRMKRLLYHNVEGAFNRADILRQRKRLRLPENGLALGVDNARRRDAVKLFTARQAVALLLPDGAISLGKSA